MKYKNHHIWCNFWNKPVEKCEQCKMLFDMYPINNLNEDELLKKYFPNAIKRTNEDF